MSCSLSGGTLTIGLSASGDYGILSRQTSNIVVSDSLNIIPCTNGPPTVNNTDTISVSDGFADNTRFDVDLGGGPFAPGLTDETTTSDEIEFEASMNAGGADRLVVIGTAGADVWRLGLTVPQGGINLNAGNEGGILPGRDVDLVYGGIEDVSVTSLSGDDRIFANGGAEFSGPLEDSTAIFAGEGDDRVIGGDGPFDLVDDGPGNDSVSGGAGFDTLFQLAGDTGNDEFDGGAGSDRLNAASVTGPLRVDLRLTGPQDTGGGGADTLTNVEEVISTTQNDVLIGTEGNDVLSANLGDDLLVGLGGADSLFGSDGVDTASYETAPAGAIEGVNVDLSVGDPQDTGGAGTDRLTGIDNLIGSPFADMLRGSDGDNLLSVRDGVGDGVTCRGGSDTVVADVDGTDTIAPDCEVIQLDFRPDTEIVSGPASLSRDSTPTFAFRTTKEGSTFECALDGAGFSACSSPSTLGPVSDGAHAFSVRSRDLLGALDLSPATQAYSVDTKRPRITRLRLLRRLRLRYVLSEAANGTNRTALPARLRRMNAAGRRFRVVLTATDAAGNRSRPARLAFNLPQA